MPSFSVVIPVFNGESSIVGCVESLLEQSYRNIEVICVEDCSSDGSRTLLEGLAAHDERVRVLRQSENRGCARARRRGVLESRGDYVLFADQDDRYVPGALKWLWEQLSRDSVDILAYDAEVVGVGEASDGEVSGVQRWVNAPDLKLQGREVLDACFVRKEYGYSIWNKVYAGEMARFALALTEDVAVPLGEDNYAYFVIAYCAKSFKGVPGHVVYQYHYGAGFTGHGRLSLDGWKRTSSLSVAAELIRSFVERQGTLADYETACTFARQHMINYAFDRFRLELANEDKGDALRIALNHWTYTEVLRAVALFSPGDLPLLMRVRFEDDSVESEFINWVGDVSRKLASIELQIETSHAMAECVRAQYESSRAYRWGRSITCPIRKLKAFLGKAKN